MNHNWIFEKTDASTKCYTCKVCNIRKVVKPYDSMYSTNYYFNSNHVQIWNYVDEPDCNEYVIRGIIE